MTPNEVTTVRYGYSASGDSPDLTLDTVNAVIEKTYGLLGGVNLTKRTAGNAQVWSYPNIHGDIIATADAAGAKPGATLHYDPYGQALGALPDNSAGNLDYGWLGQHQRPLEHETTLATIEMGARQYIPGLGRFLQVDPVEGGNFNDYEYCTGDPLNCLDLDGQRGIKIRIRLPDIAKAAKSALRTTGRGAAGALKTGARCAGKFVHCVDNIKVGITPVLVFGMSLPLAQAGYAACVATVIGCVVGAGLVAGGVYSTYKVTRTFWMDPGHDRLYHQL